MQLLEVSPATEGATMTFEDRLNASVQRNKLSLRLFATAIAFAGMGCTALGTRDLLPALLGLMYLIAVLR